MQYQKQLISWCDNTAFSHGLRHIYMLIGKYWSIKTQYVWHVTIYHAGNYGRFGGGGGSLQSRWNRSLFTHFVCVIQTARIESLTHKLRLKQCCLMLIKIRMHRNFEELVIYLQLYWYLNFQYTIHQISNLQNLAILTKKSKMVTIVTIETC